MFPMVKSARGSEPFVLPEVLPHSHAPSRQHFSVEGVALLAIQSEILHRNNTGR